VRRALWLLLWHGVGAVSTLKSLRSTTVAAMDVNSGWSGTFMTNFTPDGICFLRCHVGANGGKEESNSGLQFGISWDTITP